MWLFNCILVFLSKYIMCNYILEITSWKKESSIYSFQELVLITFVTFVDLLLFSSFSDIPGASRIKTCDKSRIKTLKKKIFGGKIHLDKNLVKNH